VHLVFTLPTFRTNTLGEYFEDTVQFLFAAD